MSIDSSSDIRVGWILRNCWRVRDTNMAGFYVRMCLVSSWWTFSANGIWRNFPSGEAANSAVSLVVSCLQVPRGTFSQDKTSQRWLFAEFFELHFEKNDLLYVESDHCLPITGSLYTGRSANSDQTARMHRLICVFAGRTCYNVYFPIFGKVNIHCQPKTWILFSYFSKKTHLMGTY